MLSSDIQCKNVFNNVFGDLCVFCDTVISFTVYVKLNIFIIVIGVAYKFLIGLDEKIYSYSFVLLNTSYNISLL